MKGYGFPTHFCPTSQHLNHPALLHLGPPSQNRPGAVMAPASLPLATHSFPPKHPPVLAPAALSHLALAPQVPAPFVMLSRGLHVVVAYDPAQLDPSEAGVADRFRWVGPLHSASPRSCSLSLSLPPAIPSPKYVPSLGRDRLELWASNPVEACPRPTPAICHAQYFFFL